MLNESNNVYLASICKSRTINRKNKKAVSKSVIICGAGLAGLATSMRLVKKGYSVTIIEKNSVAGGRLNRVEKDGFRWDMGPTFFSMSYEFEEFANECGIKLPFSYHKLDPLYHVYYRNYTKPFLIHANLEDFIAEFSDFEPDFENKLKRFLEDTGHLFHNTINTIVKRNFNSLAEYFIALVRVSPIHIPKLWRNYWQQVCSHFESKEVREIFSLVAFFLGQTPFNTPAVYTLLSYTELLHDGYHNVAGGMYEIVTGITNRLLESGVKFIFNTEIISVKTSGNEIRALTDRDGKDYTADIFVVNADAAWFRGNILKRKSFSENKLSKMKWTMAPFTIYVGINKKLETPGQHNYFLGQDFKEYSNIVYTDKFTSDQPYYYVNIPSKFNQNAAPEGHEALFFLCPVPDLRFKEDWSDKNEIAQRIIADFEKQIGEKIRNHIVSFTVLSPVEWRDSFNLYAGSGLGLAHNLGQMAYFRPKNKDETFSNLFYTGASTIPGTGLPMTIISSKLTTLQIEKHYGFVP